MLPTQLVIKRRQKAMRLRGLMKKAIGLRLLLVILLLLNSSAFAANGTITIDATKPGARIPSSLYGIFFEEISHAGEGGLYGELIQNRGFEDANLPPACKLENGFLI
jgi:alpha-L-arabinofuranosidase